MAKNRQGRGREQGSAAGSGRDRSAGVPPASDNGGGTPALRGTPSEWLGPMLIGIAAVVMLLWTWETWPDVLVDFGVERYIPWRLAEGEVLYRDISFHNGPLSQYFNAICFRVFGSSLRTLVYCNLALLAVLIALLHYTLCQIARRSAATAACVVFVLLFAFAQFVGIGNYNYVCPYAHEMTHGLLLSLAAVVAAWPRSKHGLWMATLSGLALGLAFLTKAEVFLAGAVGTAAALFLGLWLERPGWKPSLARLACFGVAFLIPPTIAFFALASVMPAKQALLGTLGSWVLAVRSDMVNLPFYREGQGFDRPWENIQAMLSMTGLYAIALVPAAIVGLLLRRPGQYRAVIAAVVFGVTAVVLFACSESIDWFGIARPLPLLMLATIAAIAVCFRFHRGEEAARRRLVHQTSLLIFAFVLLAKMIFNARICHYGFVLAMPATLLLVVAALDWIPSQIERRGGLGWVFTAAAAALLAVTTVAYLFWQPYCEAFWLAKKIWPVGAGSNVFLADARGAFVQAAVEEIGGHSSPGTTLAVLPEGVMLNCLTGLRNPTSHINFMPVELMLFGEAEMLESFRSHPPDLIALVHKDTSEIGFQFFGRDYGQQLMAWIQANYRPWSPSCLIGAMPLQSEQFGILLLERVQKLEEGKKSRE
jgi:hypothetical protein